MILVANSQVEESAQWTSRPRLLVSVRSAAEATSAIAGGADWIDLKEPRAGSLGAVDLVVARSVIEAVAGRALVSAALGELIDWPTSPARSLLTVPEISVVKLGLSGCALRSDYVERWQKAAREVAVAGKQLVAVVYADAKQSQSPAPREVICQAIAASLGYVLVDTFDKQAGSLLTHLPVPKLAEILNLASKGELQKVVAGGISTTMLAHLPERLVDVVAVRGAVCVLGRSSEVQQVLVEQFRAAMAARWPA